VSTGLGGARFDVIAGIQVAAAEGCAPDAAPALLRAISEGFIAAAAKRHRGRGNDDA
jgi:hypothetical protein